MAFPLSTSQFRLKICSRSAKKEEHQEEESRCHRKMIIIDHVAPSQSCFYILKTDLINNCKDLRKYIYLSLTWCGLVLLLLLLLPNITWCGPTLCTAPILTSSSSKTLESLSNHLCLPIIFCQQHFIDIAWRNVLHISKLGSTLTVSPENNGENHAMSCNSLLYS